MHIYALSFIITTWKTRFLLPPGNEACVKCDKIFQGQRSKYVKSKYAGISSKGTKHLSVYWLGEQLDTPIILESRQTPPPPAFFPRNPGLPHWSVCAVQPGPRQVIFGDRRNGWLLGISQRIPTGLLSQNCFAKPFFFFLPLLSVIHYPPKVKSYDPISSVS